MAKELPSLIFVLVFALMIGVGTGTPGTVFFQQGKTSYQFNIPDGETSDFADLQKELDSAPSILKTSSGLEDDKLELGLNHKPEDEVIQSEADSSTHPRGEGEEEDAALPIVGLSDHHPHPNQAYSPGEKFHARVAGKRKRLPLCRELRWPYTTSSNPVPCIPDNVDEAREKQRRFGRGGGENNPNSYLYYESPRLLPRPISPAVGITPPRPRFLLPPPSPKFQANFIQNSNNLVRRAPAPRPQGLTWPSRADYGRQEEGGSGGGWGSSPTPSPQPPQEEQGQGWSEPAPSSPPAQEEAPGGWSSSSSVPSSDQGFREQQQQPSSGWTQPEEPQQQQTQNGWIQPPQHFKQKPLRPSLLRNYQQNNFWRQQPEQQHTVGWSQQQQPEQQPQQGGWSQSQQPPPPQDTNSNNGWSQPQEQRPPQETNTNGWSQPSQPEQSQTEPSQNGWSVPNQEQQQQQQQPQQEGGHGWSSSSSSSAPDQKPHQPSQAPVDNSSGQRQGNWGRNYGNHQSPPQTFLPRQPPFALTQNKPQYPSKDKAPLPISDRHPEYARELERYRKLVVVLLRRLHTQTTSGGPHLLPRPISPVQQSNPGGSGGTPLSQGSWYGGGYANEDNGASQQPQPPPPQEQQQPQGGPSGGWQQPSGPQDNAEKQPQPSPPPSQSQFGWQQQPQGQGASQPQPSPQLYASNWRPSSTGRAIQFGNQQQKQQPQPPYVYGPAYTYGPPSPPTNHHHPQQQHQPNFSYRSEGGPDSVSAVVDEPDTPPPSEAGGGEGGGGGWGQPDQSSPAFVSQNYGQWPPPTNNYEPNVQYQHAATTETVPIIDTAGQGGSGDTDCDLGNCTANSESININNQQEINSVDAADLNPTPGELAVILSAPTSSPPPPSNKELSALVIFPVVTPTSSDEGSGGEKVDAILPASGSGRVDKNGFASPAEEDEAMLSVLRTMTIDELEASLGISPDGNQ